MTGEKLLELINDTTESIGITSNYFYNGRKPLDVFDIPLDTVADLYYIPAKYRYKGMTIIVLSGTTSDAQGNFVPEEWWLVGGTKDTNWVKKSSFMADKLAIDIQNDEGTATIGIVYNGSEYGQTTDISELVSALYWDTDGSEDL